jgi:hypothetical protein
MERSPCTRAQIGRRFAAVSSLLLMAVGCGPAIGLTSDRYMPNFDAATLPRYRGQAIVLRSFTNVDENTRFYKYPGDGREYGGPLLTSYFWYCFKTAFTRLGVNVFEDGTGPQGAPAMELKLFQISEAGFGADVLLTGAPGQPPLLKRYSIVGPPMTDQGDAALERRAYQMMTALFWKIVADPQFQTVALR